MKQRIIEELHKIEHTHNVKIIMAVESGSRAWGFDSQDSDYDVRFIYVRQTADYLKLKPIRDVIEWKLDNVLDINGWDVKKALQLLYKSNPTVFEWCASPIVYIETPEFEALKQVLPLYYSQKTFLYKYSEIANFQYTFCSKGKFAMLKKYFYVLRPLLAAKWIMDKNTIPPIQFQELMNAELDKELLPDVTRLLQMKRESSEMGVGQRIQSIHDYAERTMVEINNAIEHIGFETEKDWGPLDDLFLKFVN